MRAYSSYWDCASLRSNALEYGCVSGAVSDLIYYADTLAFFDKYKEEINTLLSDSISSFGMDSPVEMFGDRWDKEDSLILDTNNQNLLAWFAFEETLRAEAQELNLIA